MAAPPLDRTWYNTLIDDDGTGTVGTVWNRAQVDGLMDTIDASLAGLANLGIGGADKQVQFNDAGALRGDVGLYYDKAVKALGVGGTVASPTAAAGTVRLPNGAQVTVRNAANTADMFALSGWTDDKVYVGSDMYDAGLVLRSVTDIAVNRGVTFPTVAVPSANVYTLDDYRELQFTPYFAGSGGQSGQAYASQIGHCVKVGKRVVVTMHMNLTTVGTISGGLRVAGLPFAAAFYMPIVCTYFDNLPGAVAGVGGYIESGLTAASLFYLPAAGGTGMIAMGQSSLKAGTTFVLGASYISLT
jgi:hypothetical protein